LAAHRQWRPTGTVEDLSDRRSSWQSYRCRWHARLPQWCGVHGPAASRLTMSSVSSRLGR
jgi:hypothetical protein